MQKLPYLNVLKPKLIWQLEQNKPKLIARDLSHYGVDPDTAYAILLARGVFKWLWVREQIIKLTHQWKIQITGLNQALHLHDGRDKYELGYLRGQLAMLEQCREEVRGLKKVNRWISPDDRHAQRFLDRLTEELEAE